MFVFVTKTDSCCCLFFFLSLSPSFCLSVLDLFCPLITLTVSLSLFMICFFPSKSLSRSLPSCDFAVEMSNSAGIWVAAKALHKTPSLSPDGHQKIKKWTAVLLCTSAEVNGSENSLVYSSVFNMLHMEQSACEQLVRLVVAECFRSVLSQWTVWTDGIVSKWASGICLVVWKHNFGPAPAFLRYTSFHLLNEWLVCQEQGALQFERERFISFLCSQILPVTSVCDWNCEKIWFACLLAKSSSWHHD